MGDNKTEIAQRRESMTAGADSKEYIMGYVDKNFGKAFASDKDQDRFCAGLAAEMMRNLDLRDLVRDDPWARQQLLVIAASCIADGIIPSFHTMFTVRNRMGTKTVTRDDKLEGCLAILENHGYRAQRPILVYEGDKFTQKRAIINGKLTFELHHEPCGEDDPNKITGCYLPLERIADGHTDWEYAPRKVFDAARKAATRWMKEEGKAYSPWYQNFGEMCQKHLAKRAVRYLNRISILDTSNNYRTGEGVASMLNESSMSDEDKSKLQEQFISGATDQDSVYTIEDYEVVQQSEEATEESDIDTENLGDLSGPALKEEENPLNV